MHAGGRAARTSLRRLGPFYFVAAVVFALITGCSGGLVLDPAPGSANLPRSIAAERDVIESVTQLDGDGAVILALKASQLFFDSAQVVVLADANEPAAITRAASIAIALGTPMLLTLPDGEHVTSGSTVGSLDSGSGTLNTELLRLGTRAVLTVGGVSLHQIDTTSLIISPAPDKIEELSDLVGTPLTDVASPPPEDALQAVAGVRAGEVFHADKLAPGPAGYGSFPQVILPVPRRQVMVVSDDNLAHQAALATARAAGAQALVAPEDPASLTSVVAALAAHPSTPVVSMSDRYSNEADLAHAVAAMRTGVELPAGGQRVFSVDAHPVRYVVTDADSTDAHPAVASSHHADSGTATPPSDGGTGAAEGNAKGSAPKADLTKTRLSTDEIVALARTHAADYSPADTSTVVPAVWLKTGPGRWPESLALQDWVEATAKEDQLLLLGFGTADGVLSEQVERYQDVLADPHLGVMVDLASASATIDSGEVNDLILLMRGVVRDSKTPQRLLQIQVRDAEQIRNLSALLGSTDEVAVVITVAGGDTVADQTRLWTELRELNLPVSWGWTVVSPQAQPPDDGDEPTPVKPVPVTTQLKTLDVDPDVLTYP